MELRERFKQLAAERDRVEQEISVASAQLEASGAGKAGPLVDAEVRAHAGAAVPLPGGRSGSSWVAQGFPLADVDLYAVRADRQRIAGAQGVWVSPRPAHAVLCG